MQPALEQRWNDWWNRVGARGDRDAEFTAVAKRYRESHRHYHTFWHIEECLRAFDGTRDLCKHPDAVEMAVWYHDLVYDTRRKDNEAQSAELAVETSRRLGLDNAFADCVRDLILQTTHQSPPVGHDARILIDIDLSSLGCAPDAFAANTEKVRREYDWVPQETFNSGRAAIFRALLARPAVYSTPHFHAKYEKQARANLQRYLESASDDGGKQRVETTPEP